MGLLSALKTWVDGEILTANDQNNMNTNILNNLDPEHIEDYSENATEMQSTADPYPGGSVSLATNLMGELTRLRYMVKQITGQSQWYIDAPNNLTALGESYGIYKNYLTIGADTEHDITLGIGEVALTDGTNWKLFHISQAFTKQIDGTWAEGAGTGITGGMALDGGTGTALLAANTWYYIYLIGKADGSYDAGIDTDGTDATNLMASAGTDYTYYRLRGAVKTNAASNFVNKQVYGTSTATCGPDCTLADAGPSCDFAGNHAIFLDRKNQNVNGGTFTTGGLRTRDLTLARIARIPGCTLGTNTVNLPIGKYKAKFWGLGNRVGGFVVSLKNSTDGTIIQHGFTGYSDTADGNFVSSGEVTFGLSAAKNLNLVMRGNSTKASDGFGKAANVDGGETYAGLEVEVIRLGA